MVTTGEIFRGKIKVGICAVMCPEQEALSRKSRLHANLGRQKTEILRNLSVMVMSAESSSSRHKDSQEEWRQPKVRFQDRLGY